jgi:hypothetical protein
VGVFFFALNVVLGIAIPLSLQLLDRRRMTPEERRWVWNFASWGAALYNFGPASLVAWGYVTRSPRYWRGLFRGALMAMIALVAQGLVCELVGRAAGFPEKDLAETRLGFEVMMAAMAALAVVLGLGRSVYEAVRRLGLRSAPPSSGRAAILPYRPPRERVVPPRAPRDLHHHEQRQDGADRDR